MPVVPIRPNPGLAPPTAALKPPDPNFLLMAAAQMHSEGRLVQSQASNRTLGHEEWENQGQSDVRATTADEPPQADQSRDIMQRLGLAKKARELDTAHKNAALMGLGIRGPGVNFTGGQEI